MNIKNAPSVIFAAILIMANHPFKREVEAQGLEVAASIGAEQLMNNVIDKARTAIVSIIEKLDDSVGSATFLTKMQLTNILSELDFRSKEVIGKTFSEVNQSQKVFFSNLVSTINDLNSLGDRVADNADGVLKRSQMLLAMVPFADKEPRLSTQYPKIALDKDILSNKNIEVSFGGSFLAHGTPQLILEDKKCTVKSSSDFGVKFSCDVPDSWFNAPASSQYIRNIDGTLSVALEQNFWKKLTGLLHSNIDYKTYVVNVSVIPEKFAVITTKLIQTNVVNVFQSRSSLFDSGARHCVSGSSSITNLSPAAPGWQIDVNSINVLKNSCNNGGALAINVTASGFQVRAWGNNSGSCGPFGIGKDARGWCNGTVSWKESSPQAAPTELSIPPKDVSWGERVVTPLPDRATKIITKIRMFDGKVREYEQTGGNEFFKYTLSPDNSTVSIEPKELKEAFK